MEGTVHDGMNRFFHLTPISVCRCWENPLYSRLAHQRRKHTVGIAQLVSAPDCGSGGRGFESLYPPHFPAGAHGDFVYNPFSLFGSLAQLAEQGTLNPKVRGSNPRRSTIKTQRPGHMPRPFLMPMINLQVSRERRAGRLAPTEASGRPSRLDGRSPTAHFVVLSARSLNLGSTACPTLGYLIMCHGVRPLGTCR